MRPATVNRGLATLRNLLGLAQEWKLIARVPRIRLLGGERNRECVLGHGTEALYLEMAPAPLKHFTTLDVDTGLRVGEVLALERADVHLVPAAGARFGYIHVSRGKSKYARRNMPLTGRARKILENLLARNSSRYVFAGVDGNPLLVAALEYLHRKLRKALKMPGDFVLHSLRHTYGTRLGEAGADAFTIMRLMGHSSVTISQRYVHPTSETLERAVERLEALNESGRKRLAGDKNRTTPTTISATVPEALTVTH